MPDKTRNGGRAVSKASRLRKRATGSNNTVMHGKQTSLVSTDYSNKWGGLPREGNT